MSRLDGCRASSGCEGEEGWFCEKAGGNPPHLFERVQGRVNPNSRITLVVRSTQSHHCRDASDPKAPICMCPLTCFATIILKGILAS